MLDLSSAAPVPAITDSFLQDLVNRLIPLLPHPRNFREVVQQSAVPPAVAQSAAPARSAPTATLRAPVHAPTPPATRAPQPPSWAPPAATTAAAAAPPATPQRPARSPITRAPAAPSSHPMSTRARASSSTPAPNKASAEAQPARFQPIALMQRPHQPPVPDTWHLVRGGVPLHKALRIANSKRPAGQKIEIPVVPALEALND